MTQNQKRYSEATDKVLLPKNFISRRGFLKACGLTALSTSATSFVLTPHLAKATPLVTSVPDDLWSIVTASPLFERVETELSQQNLVIAPEKQDVGLGGKRETLVGLVAQCRSVISPRSGADVVMTIDVEAQELLAIHYVKAWALDCSLELQSVLLTRENLLEQEIHIRGGILKSPQQRFEQHLSFPRQPEDIPSPPDSLLVEGWAEEREDSCFWHYAGCQSVGWTTYQEVTIQYCAQVAELQSCAKDQQRVCDIPPFE